MGVKAKLNDVMEKVSVMDYEEEEILLDILRHRHIERRREMILESSKKTLKEYRAGVAKKGTSKDLWEDLKNA